MRARGHTYLACKRHTNTLTRLFQFLHTVSAQYGEKLRLMVDCPWALAWDTTDVGSTCAPMAVSIQTAKFKFRQIISSESQIPAIQYSV